MLLKILIVGALAVGLMATLKDRQLMVRAGLLSSCSSVVVDGKPDPTLQSCRKGRLDGYPDLTNKSCKSIGMYANGQEYWRCAASVVSSQSPNG